VTPFVPQPEDVPHNEVGAAAPATAPPACP